MVRAVSLFGLLLTLAGIGRADVTFQAVPLLDVKADLAQLKQIELARYNGTLPSSYWWPWGIKAADLDKDGRPDLYINFHSGVGGLLLWNKSDAQGLKFTRDTQFDDAAGWGNRKLPLENPPLFVDLDGDGWPDVVSMGDESGNKRGNLKNVAGALTLKGKGPGFSYGTVKDLSGDGLPDLFRVVRGYGKTNEQRRILKPDWTWTTPATIPVPTPEGIPAAIAAKLAALAVDTSTANRYGGPIFREVDLNGDGRLDLIVQYANAYTDNTTYRWVAYCVRNADGVLEETNLGIVGLELSVGDYNGDGRVDIFTSQATGAGLFLQQADGTYKNASPPNAAKTSISDFAKGKDSYGYGIQALDLDRDGDLDLFVYNRRSGGGRVFQNTAGTYTQILTFRHWDADGFDVADVNGDGLLDLIAGGQPTDDDVTVYLNTSVPPAPPPPPAPAGTVKLAAVAGMAITFAADVTGTGELTYAWDFGDGSVGQGKTPSHTYAAAGEYAVTVTITDPLGQTGTATLAVTVTDPLPPRGSRLPLPSEDQATPAFARLKAMADRPTGTQGGPTALAYLYRVTGDRKYGDAAVKSLDIYLVAAEEAIAAGNAPAIARDQCLYVGAELSRLASCYDWCHDLLTPEKKARVEAFAEQALFNLWNPSKSTWGGKPFPWSGYGVNKPSNNYHHSYVRATTAWALASQNKVWLDLMQTDKWPKVAAALAPYAEGGSPEGTGYGPAVRYLFEAMRWWKDAGRTLPPELTAHAAGWVDYWIHATTPDFSRFAPFGDQARDSQARQYDYHRQVMLEAVRLAPDSDEAKRGRWWLAAAFPKMTREENAYYDLLADGGVVASPTATYYSAPGTGHYFWRSGWDAMGSFLALSVGTLRADHDHGDKGTFCLWKGGWRSVTANVHSKSGIRDLPDVMNGMLFARDGKALPQKMGIAPKVTVTQTVAAALPTAGVQYDIELGALYATPGLTWNRSLRFDGRVLSLRDDVDTPPDVTATWQLQTPDEPVLAGPAAFGTPGMSVWLDAALTKTSWAAEASGAYLSGWRVSAGGARRYEAKLILR